MISTRALIPTTLIVVLAVFSGCGGCPGGGDGGPAFDPALLDGPAVKGGRLIDSSIGEPSVLLPPLVTDSASGQITGLVFSSLLKIGKDLTLEPEIARSWDISDDGLEIVFHLRDDVRFHDGEALTAEDVVFSYDVMMDDGTFSPYKPRFMDVESFEKLDEYTVRVRYRRPFAPALDSFAGLAVLPKHLLEGENIMESDLRYDPVGSGPYRFVEWRRGDRVVLEANPDYFDGEPYITRYLLRIIPDQATTFLEMRAGGVDKMTPTPVQYARQTDSRFFNENVNKYEWVGFGYTYMGFNHTDDRFKDARVRRAISMAIDRNELVQGVLMGLGVAANGPYKPGAWFHNDAIDPVGYDPEGAIELLKEAGYEQVGGRMVQPDGRPFRFVLLTNQGNESRRRTAEILQRRLGEIGIEVEPRIIEWSALINDFIDKKRFDAIILGWNTGIDPDQYLMWHSSQTGPKEYNFASFKNDEVDELLERGRATFDQDERQKIYHRLQEVLHEEQPYAFLYVPNSMALVRNNIAGIEPAEAGIAWNFERWWIPQPLQTTR